MKISQVTRRDIFDVLMAEGLDWVGREDNDEHEILKTDGQEG